MEWHLYEVKIVLLLFNVGTQSNPYQPKLTCEILALSREKNIILLSQ
jgi:hypothetical protein